MKTTIAVIVTIGFVALVGVYRVGKQAIEHPASSLTTLDFNLLAIKLAQAGVVDEVQGPLNTLWAFGLANKNPILEQGQMVEQGGNPTRFASVGGFTISKGPVMNHYGAHQFAILTPSQQYLVERVSQNIYRPCCDNPAYFPDCNHGMAMLGLLELMAVNGSSEEQMYQTALETNKSWFPDAYRDIESYLGKNYSKISPKELLGYEFSSASGYQRVLAGIAPVQQEQGGGSSCGV